jgi:hypothetical protein
LQLHRLIAEHLQWPETETVVCGRSLGHAGPNAIEHSLVTERAPVAGFAIFPD